MVGPGTASKKKEKKSKKSTSTLDAPPVPPIGDACKNLVVDEPVAADDSRTAPWTIGTKAKGSKSKTNGVIDVTADSTPDAAVTQPASIQENLAEDDIWSSFGTTGKRSKKLNKKVTGAEAPSPLPPPPAPMPPVQGLDDSLHQEADLLDFGDAASNGIWGTSETKPSTSKMKKSKDAKNEGKSKDKNKGTDILDVLNETPSKEIDEAKIGPSKEDKKALKSTSAGKILFGSTKTKTKEKEKEKREKEAAEDAEAKKKEGEAAFAMALGDDDDDILEIVEEKPSKKSSRDKKDKDPKKPSGDRSSKCDGKSSQKALPDTKPEHDLNMMDEGPVSPKEEPKAEGWGFWSSSLKSSAKKATTATESKKEIGNNDASATKQSALGKVTDDKAEEDRSATSPPLSKTLSSKSKSTTKGSSIQDRIKALPVDKDASNKKTAPPPDPDPQPEPKHETEPLVEDKKASKKTASTSKSSKNSTAKEFSPPPDTVAPPKSPSPLPGGFPTDDLLDASSPMPPPTKKSSKDKKPSKSSKKSDAPNVVDPLLKDLLDDEPKLPTPPPEKTPKKDKDEHKPSKKERPKVVRDQQSSSWGFWGAAPPPKSSTKAKEDSKDAATSSGKDKPGLSRSKSARKPDKHASEKVSRSSGSDKDAQAPKSRPSTSRGMSFSGMFGMSGMPQRSKSTREKHSSRRQSTAAEDNGLVSPPPEDVKPKGISDKAARVMGVSRSKSTREPRRVPDPYSIDSDDAVMVENPEDSAKDMPQFDIPSSREKRTKSGKSKRHSTRMSGGLGDADDDVMVDVPRPSDIPEELVEKPLLVRRGTSSAKKSGIMGGIFGAFGGGRPTIDRKPTKAYDSEDGTPRRKRVSAYDDDSGKKLRHEDRKVGRSRKVSDADGFTDVAPPPDDYADSKEARRAERRARAEREAPEADSRATRRRDRDDSRRGKDRPDEDEREVRRQEERRARRAEREARRAEEDRLAREEEVVVAERRERRRERDRPRESDSGAPRPTQDRRRSHLDRPHDDEARRARREERKSRRPVEVDTGVGSKDRPRVSRRRTEAPMDDYLDRRNGELAFGASDRARAPDADGHAFVKAPGGKPDKTANWVDSINQDPPPPPPVEGTIVDAPVHFAGSAAPDPPTFEDTTAREMRHRRRRENDGHGRSDADARRRRDEAQKSSNGSSRDRRRAYGGEALDGVAGYNDLPHRAYDFRPGMASKRQSWFQKMTGM